MINPISRFELSDWATKGNPYMADLSTPWSRAMGLDAPILNAPMGGVAGGRLSAAVSEAGGLGMIGVGSAGSVELLEREAALPQSAGLPFGIGLLDWALALEPQLLDAAIGASPALISVSFGDTWRWAERVRKAENRDSRSGLLRGVGKIGRRCGNQCAGGQRSGRWRPRRAGGRDAATARRCS